jgi:TolB-like protein/Flp pilus assembly protein TadD
LTTTDSFWKRLIERKIVQWAVAYIAGGVVLLEFADYLGRAFDFPSPTIRVLTVLVAFGFIALLIIAWYHGERGHQRVRTTEVMLLLLVAVAAGGVAWRVGAATPEFRGSRRSRDAAPVTNPVAPAREGKSIAVLPFINRSINPDNEYFSDAMTEDIIAALARYPGLRVISRTSMMQYKNTNKTVPQIRQELSVDYVLEGSVQREANQLHITARLIDAALDQPVWNQSYDRNLSNILAIQSDVSRDIALQLNATLDPTQVAIADTADLPEVDAAALELAMKGRQLLNSETAAEREQGAQLIDEAVTKDAKVASTVSASLAQRMVPGADAAGLPVPPVDSTITRVMNRLSEKVPNAPEFRMMFSRGADRSLSGAIAGAKQFAESFPNNTQAQRMYGTLLGLDGQFENALIALRRAESLDPLSARLGTQIGEMLLAAGRPDEAIATLHRTRAATGNREPEIAEINLALAFHERGQPDSALFYADQAAAHARQNPIVLGNVGYIYAISGRRRDASAVLDTLRRWDRSDQRAVPAVAIAQVQAGLGNMERALQTLKQGTDARSAMFLSPRFLTLPEMEKDPAFNSWLRTLRDSLSFPSRTPPRAGARGR